MLINKGECGSRWKPANVGVEIGIFYDDSLILTIMGVKIGRDSWDS